MITRENLKEVISLIDAKDKKRILNSNSEYCVIYLHTFNVGSYVSVKLTNDYSRYANVSNNGNCILETSEVINLLN